MITSSQIATIKVAQKDANLSDKEYRMILYTIAGVVSCKLLNQAQFDSVLVAIKNHQHKLKGWQPKQIRTAKRYLRYCHFDKANAEEILFQISGVRDYQSSILSQIHFDQFMAYLEEQLSGLISDGWVNTPPDINLQYWRNRLPTQGSINSREGYALHKQWERLQVYLPPQKRQIDYLLGIASRVCGRQILSLNALSSQESLHTIDAIKLKIRNEVIKMKKETSHE